MKTENRTWLVFANEDKCNHRKALRDLGYVSWFSRSKFAENDIVFLFMNDDRAVRFKLRVAKVGVPREDSDYWIAPAPNDLTSRLELIEEYDGNMLDEDVLRQFGFKGGRSILNSTCNNTELIGYINDVFEITSRTIKLPSHYVVVDLGSGAYCKSKIGHEVFNLEPNKVDGRFYGYVPPYDNPNIEKLGAAKADEYVDGVMVVYVEKLQDSNNRKMVAFTDNAKVYAQSQSGASLKRFIDHGKTECTYTIESDYIYDLRTETKPFVFDVSDNDLRMFRGQRFYKGRRPRQEVKMLLWLTDYLQEKRMEEDNDLGFQIGIQNAEMREAMSDTSKQQPIYNNGKSGRTVAKKAAVSKQALKNANFKCMFDERHETFLTNKGKPYMEGHHLIPCTASNSEYFWSQYGINIDCVENIVSLCPTCHRRIHFGSKEEQNAIIGTLYEKQKALMKSVGIDISIDKLLGLYK